MQVGEPPRARGNLEGRSLLVPGLLAAILLVIVATFVIIVINFQHTSAYYRYLCESARSQAASSQTAGQVAAVGEFCR